MTAVIEARDLRKSYLGGDGTPIDVKACENTWNMLKGENKDLDIVSSGAYEFVDSVKAGASDWRKANDTVREIGGWRAYAREIQGGSQAQPGATAPSAAPARAAAPANPHQGHTR